MMNHRYTNVRGLGLGWVFAITQLVVACVGAATSTSPSPSEVPSTTQPPTTSPEEKPTEQFVQAVDDWCNPTPYLAKDFAELGPVDFEPATDGDFFAGQVLLTGDPDIFDDVITDLGAEFAFNQVDEIEPSELEGLSEAVGVATPAIGLFTFDPSRLVTEVIQEISSLGYLVIAEPNYIVSAHTHGIFGGPFGSLAVDGEEDPVTANHAYHAQWALAASGIDSAHYATSVGAENRLTGDGATIVLLDSSPFAKQGMWEITRAGQTDQVCVWLPQTQYMMRRFDGLAENMAHGLYTELGADVVESGIEHGLFTYGMVKSIAPGAEVHLIRVLDDEGLGDTFTLIKAMTPLVQSEFKGVILNTSLGIQRDEAQLGIDTVTAIRNMIAATQWTTVYSDTTVPNPMVGPRIPFLLATLNESLVIAASGNSSFDRMLQLFISLIIYFIPSVFNFILGLNTGCRLY